jgi:hypothetical protein
LIGWYSFRKKISSRMFGVGKIDITRMVNDSAIDLLGNALIETTIAGFHVEDWNMALLCRDDTQTAVGIAEYEYGVWLFLGQNLVSAFDDICDSCGACLGSDLEKVVRLSYSKLGKEDFI